MSNILHASLPSTSFTCNTCGIRFIAADLQREHMKTSWHRYNLKRRVANLPCVTSDVFAHKVLHQEQLSSLQKEVDEFGFEIRRPRKKSGDKRGRIIKLSVDDSSREVSPAKSIVSEFSQFSLGPDIERVSEYSDTHSEYESGDYGDTGSELNYSDLDSDEGDPNDIEGDEENGSSNEIRNDGAAVHENDQKGRISELVDSDFPSDNEYIEVMPITHCFYCGKNNKEIELNLKHMFNNHGLYIPERSYLSDLQGLLTFLSEIVYIDNECFVCGFEGKSLESVRQHMTSKGHCKVPYETDMEKAVIEEFYEFDFVEESNMALSSKIVKFDDKTITIKNPRPKPTRSRSFDNDRKLLPTGLEVGHRQDQKYFHKPASSILKSKESTVAMKPLSPGLSARTVSKQMKQTRKIEGRKANWQNSNGRLSRNNFQKHYRDEFLQ